MLEERRTCSTCGAFLHPEPDLRVQYRQSQRDATGTAHLQQAATLGRFKCPRCGGWSEYQLWEVRTQRDSAEPQEDRNG